jgi:hypothetical protein
MRKLLLLSSVIFLVGCGSTRVVFVDTQADLVRIGPDVEGKVYIRKDGELKMANGFFPKIRSSFQKVGMQGDYLKSNL